MEKGDILLLSDGRLLRIIDPVALHKSGLFCVQFMDRDEESYTDPEKLNVEENLGQKPATLASFYTTRSIHLRLNRMSKV